MNLKIQSLCEKIKQNKITQVWLSKKEEPIKASKLLKQEQKVFDKEILYVGRLSDLSGAFEEMLEGSFICIQDILVPKQLQPPTKINLILVDPASSLEGLFNEVQDILLDSYYFMRSSAALLNSIIQGRGLQYIMAIGSELLGNPLMLGDSNHRLLAYSKCDDVEDAAWNELKSMGYCTYDYTIKYDFKKWIEKSASSHTPVIGDLGPANPTKRIFATVNIDGKLVGHLAVLEHKKPFTEKDLEIVSFICDVLASEMQKNKHYFNARNIMLENLILSLLKEDPPNPQAIFDQIKYLKWKLPKYMYVLAIKYNSYEDTFGLISYIRETLKHLSAENETVFFENHLLLIVGPQEGRYLKKEDFLELITFLKQNKLTAGISQAFCEIINLKNHYHQALTCMQLGEKMGKEEVLFMYEDYAAYHLIDLCCKQHDPSTFCHPAVIKLQAYDEEHKTDYLKTLFTYITAMRNLGAAADALYIHRNTLSYRLSKIQEIIELTPDNDDLSLNLFLSYKILEYSGKL